MIVNNGRSVIVFSETESSLERWSTRRGRESGSVAERDPGRSGAHFQRGERPQRRYKSRDQYREINLYSCWFRWRRILMTRSRAKASTSLLSYFGGMSSNYRGGCRRRTLSLIQNTVARGRFRTTGACFRLHHRLLVAGGMGRRVGDENTDHQNQPEPDMGLYSVCLSHLYLSCLFNLSSRVYPSDYARYG